MAKVKCTQCGKMFRMGYDGVCSPADLCDTCAGVSRDANGETWEKDATEQQYLVLATGEVETVKRKDVGL